MEGLKGKSIAVIGVGNIGKILLRRLIEAGVEPSQMMICDSDVAHTQEAADAFDVGFAPLGADICNADILLFAVPPKALLELLKEIGASLKLGCVVISFAAAVPVRVLESLLPEGVSVARMMPNAPSLVGEGMNPVSYGRGIEAGTKAAIAEILAALGESMEIGDELMNACVGLTGAAMRTVLPLLEGMILAA